MRSTSGSRTGWGGGELRLFTLKSSAPSESVSIGAGGLGSGVTVTTVDSWVGGAGGGGACAGEGAVWAPPRFNWCTCIAGNPSCGNPGGLNSPASGCLVSNSGLCSTFGGLAFGTGTGPGTEVEVEFGGSGTGGTPLVVTFLGPMFPAMFTIPGLPPLPMPLSVPGMKECISNQEPAPC